MEKLIHEIAGINPQDHIFDAKMNQFIDEVTNHIDTEEEEIFDEARKSLPEYRLEELGLEMEDRKKIFGELAA
jgi:hemerythrin superfamily protein